MVKLGSFWHELKRRNVLRAGVLYAAAAWLLVQVATQVFPFFHIPEWIVRWIVVACLIGAPFWLALAWFYELTPDGLKREAEVAPHESVARDTGRKLDYAIIAVLAMAVIVLAANTLVWRKGAGLQTDAAGFAALLTKVPEKSLAVLPLINEGGNKAEQYFSDGISEDLITALSQFAGMKGTTLTLACSVETSGVVTTSPLCGIRNVSVTTKCTSRYSPAENVCSPARGG